MEAPIKNNQHGLYINLFPVRRNVPIFPKRASTAIQKEYSNAAVKALRRSFCKPVIYHNAFDNQRVVYYCVIVQFCHK